MDRLQSAWESHVDTHTDPSGEPYDDDAHQQAEQQRNAQAWDAYETFAGIAARLVASAEQRRPHLPAGTAQPRWGWQLGVLTALTRQLDTVSTTAEEALSDLPPGAGSGSDAYERVLADRAAAAWPLLEEWALHAPAVVGIRAAAGPDRPQLTTRAPAPPAPASVSRPVRR
ncbi:hypothetical protein [Streptomyces sp. NPDC088789]|uniref:hypothetical protein n=1 Tax=Streptomyces sp. NPDC088789 TaxID=3365899 RepID=UPI0037F80E4B